MSSHVTSRAAGEPPPYSRPLPSLGRQTEADPNRIPPSCTNPDPVACEFGQRVASRSVADAWLIQRIHEEIVPAERPPHEYVRYLLDCGEAVTIHGLTQDMRVIVGAYHPDSPVVQVWLAAERRDATAIERIVGEQVNAGRGSTLHAGVMNVARELVAAWAKKKTSIDPLQHAATEMGLPAEFVERLLADPGRCRIAFESFVASRDHLNTRMRLNSVVQAPSDLIPADSAPVDLRGTEVRTTPAERPVLTQSQAEVLLVLCSAKEPLVDKEIAERLGSGISSSAVRNHTAKLKSLGLIVPRPRHGYSITEAGRQWVQTQPATGHIADT